MAHLPAQMQPPRRRRRRYQPSGCGGARQHRLPPWRAERGYSPRQDILRPGRQQFVACHVGAVLRRAARRPPSPLLPPPAAEFVAAVLPTAAAAQDRDNLMYSYALLYLPLSTYSLICATQLAFNAVFSYFLNKERLTALVFNSVVLLTFSAALVGVGHGSDATNSSVPEGKFAAGFALTLAASALFALILSLMQLTFDAVLRRDDTAAVLELQLWSNAAAACVSVAGLFFSGEWGSLAAEMGGYKKGKVAYGMTLAWTAASWQLCTMGMVGLVAAVSSLFTNVISTVGMPLSPVVAVIFLGDRMDGVKVLAMLIGIWGFLSYIYQRYLDDAKSKKAAESADDTLTAEEKLTLAEE